MHDTTTFKSKSWFTSGQRSDTEIKLIYPHNFNSCVDLMSFISVEIISGMKDTL
jgi:hypothetical protein